MSNILPPDLKDDLYEFHVLLNKFLRKQSSRFGRDAVVHGALASGLGLLYADMVLEGQKDLFLTIAKHAAEVAIKNYKISMGECDENGK